MPKQLNRFKPYHSLALSAVVMAVLTACGEDSDNQPRSGDQVFQTVKLDGVPVLSESYRYYSVGKKGELSLSQDLNTSSESLVRIMESRTVDQQSPLVVAVKDTVLPIETTKAFYKDLWLALRTYYPEITEEEVIQQISDLDVNIEEIYQDVQNSGLSVKDYVALFEKLDRFSNAENIEFEAGVFFEKIEMSASDFLKLLADKNSSWDALLAKMTQKQTSFTALHQAWIESSLPLSTYLDSYLQTSGGPNIRIANAPAASIVTEPAGATQALEASSKNAARSITISAVAAGAGAVALFIGQAGAKIAEPVVSYAFEVIKNGQPHALTHNSDSPSSLTL